MVTQHRHKFRRLSDVALFCECGEIRYVAEAVCTRPHYYPYWPTWITPYYPPTWTPTITTSGTSPYPADNGTITYALIGGTQ